MTRRPPRMLGPKPEGSAARPSAVPPGDAEIREALVAWLRKRHEAEQDVTIVQELGLCRGQVRVDVALVNGLLHGFEIKSDRDSLRRLAGQVAVYERVLDRASLVVGSRHVDDAFAAVPAWWEIRVVDLTTSGLRLKRVRAGRRNPRLDGRALVELLWRDDALGLLAAREATRGYRGRPRRDIWDRICALYKTDEIAGAVRARLKARSAQRVPPPPS